MNRTVSLSLFAIAGVVLLAAGACSTTESENIKTSGIWARFEVDHYEDGQVVCLGTLRVGGASGTMIDLSGGEYIECNGVVMSEYVEPVTDYRWTRAEVAVDPEGLYDFLFVRLGGEEVLTTVMVADAPVIEELFPAGVIYGGESLTVYWDPTFPGDDVDVHVEGVCIENQSIFAAPDDGEYTFDSVNADPAVGGDCELDVTVVRNIEDAVNPAYQGGYTVSRRHYYTTISFEEIAPL